jgi:hypothetical protein
MSKIAKANKPKQGAKRPTTANQAVSAPAWLSVTKESVTLAKTARALDEALKESFGQLSISKFEKTITEIDMLGDAERSLVAPEYGACLIVYESYLKAREAANGQRQLFRGSIAATSLSASLSSLREKMEEKDS